MHKQLSWDPAQGEGGGGDGLGRARVGRGDGLQVKRWHLGGCARNPAAGPQLLSTYVLRKERAPVCVLEVHGHGNRACDAA